MLVMLAQPVLGDAVAINQSQSGDPSYGSAYGADGVSNGRQCPCCGYPMKLCLPPSEYKWICHSCGYFTLR